MESASLSGRLISGKTPQYSSSKIRTQDRPASSLVAIVTILWLVQEELEIYIYYI